MDNGRPTFPFFPFFALCFKFRLALVIISSVFTLDYVNPTPKQFRFLNDFFWRLFG